ncbi:hypothetical protein C5473_21850 [Leptospira interrogans serovar Weerasinghe]|nr:hypothetical protein C5473_21850 [Leptospira interrogans serovar Weerasinghe]
MVKEPAGFIKKINIPLSGEILYSSNISLLQVLILGKNVVKIRIVFFVRKFDKNGLALSTSFFVDFSFDSFSYFD